MAEPSHYGPEAEREWVFTVRVKSFDRGDQRALLDHVATLGRALHHAFGGSASIDGYTYDALAHDGEHVGHDVIVQEIKARGMPSPTNPP